MEGLRMGSGTGVTQQLLTSVTAERVAVRSAPARTARGRGLRQLPGPLPVGNPVDGPARQGWAELGAPNPCPAPPAAQGAPGAGIPADGAGSLLPQAGGLTCRCCRGGGPGRW